MANKEVGLNHVDHQFEMFLIQLLLNQNHQMTKLIYLPKESKKRVTMNDLVDSICSNEYAKKVLFLLTIKHQIMQKFIR